jgi:acetolactate synthase I/II/III large subunit
LQSAATEKRKEREMRQGDLLSPDQKGDQLKTVAAFIIDVMAALGVDTVFSLTGGMAMHINAAVARSTRIRKVYCLHEQGCVAAAEGYSKASSFRIPGLAVVTAGPGVSNSITPLISAYGDSAPVILLAGQVKTEDIDTFGVRTHGIQEIDSIGLTAHCVKRATRIQADRCREQLAEVLGELMTDRPGPVFIEVPLDVQGTPMHYSSQEISEVVTAVRGRWTKRIDLKDIGREVAAVAAALREAKRPLLHLGNGVRIAGIEADIIAWARSLGIPYQLTWLSLDVAPASDSLNMGCPGGLAPIYANQILMESDVVIFLGSRLDLGTTAYQRDRFARQALCYVVDVDERELGKFEHLPQFRPIHANLRAFFADIRKHRIELSCNSSAWRSLCEDRKSAYLLDEASRLGSREFTIYNLTQILNRYISEVVVVPASSGYAEETLTRFIQPQRGTRFFNGAALGSMGLGLSNAIGASLATDHNVWCFEADGGLYMNLQELATYARLGRRNLTLFVLNNGGYESIRASQRRHFGLKAGADDESGLFLPSLENVAAAFDLGYRRIETLDEFEACLSSREGDERPRLVDLVIPKQEPRGPAVRTIVDPSGQISSTPLEDIDW